LAELLRKPGNLLRATVNAVDGLQQQALVDHGELDIALEKRATSS
jgi:hypothetical protein